MMREFHTAQQATLAADGIPLHFGDLKAEYHAGLERAVLMDRSHESRIEVTGRDRLGLIHRISTNDLTSMAVGEGRPTIFTNAHARILDRAFVYNRGENALLLSEPGRGLLLVSYLQRNVFFNDDFKVTDLSAATHLFALHGPAADAVMQEWSPGISHLLAYGCADVMIAGAQVFIARRIALSGTHWVIVAPVEHAASIWSSLLEAGKTHGLIPAGSFAYNALRIRAGRPAIGRELSQDYIPLEAGLWDEVSFTKGCYTGQEIIARMESRNRLAKVMVTLELASSADAPTDLYQKEHKIGVMTSSVTTPDEEHLALGFVKLSAAVPGNLVAVGGVTGTITALAGAPPPQLSTESATQEEA